MSLIRELSRPPVVVHHMAAVDGSPYPQNSLEAIRASLEAGAQIIEVDITALADADGALVLEDGRPVGVITRHDMLAFFASEQR